MDFAYRVTKKCAMERRWGESGGIAGDLGCEMCVQPRFCSAEIGKRSIELRFEGGIEDGSEFRTWFHSALDEVATQEDWTWCCGLELHFAGAGKEIGEAFRSCGRIWRAAVVVGLHKQAKFLDGGGREPTGEAADGARCDLLQVCHMPLDERGGVFLKTVGRTDPFEKLLGNADAERVMCG